MSSSPEYGLSDAQARSQSGPSADPGAHSIPLGAALRSLLQEAGSLAYEHLLLAALEAQRAGRNLVRMIVAGIFASVLVVTAWLALVAALASWWVDHGASWAQAFTAMAIMNLVIAGAVAYWIRHMVGELMFSATLRALRGYSDTSADTARANVPAPTAPEVAR